VRSGFRMILGAEDDVEVVGEASDGAEALTVVAQLRPDVVLMDVQMPEMDGLTATRRLLAAHRDDVRVLILTTFERDDYIMDALRAGASGFLLKNSSPEDLVQAVRVVAAGDALLAPSVTRRIIERVTDRPERPDLAVHLERLTDRELDVLRLVASGRSNAEIATELILGEATIKTHVSRVLMKLQVRDRVQAVVFAYESGLVRPGD
jgi:DNA-binding NarL/FixJ family response regulator